MALKKTGRLAKWTDRPILSITEADANAMLNDIVARGRKAMARTTKDLCRAMFKWLKQSGRLPVNPFADLPAPGGAKVERERFLTTDEIRQVWRALDQPERFKISHDAATALRLILVTAARPGNVVGPKGVICAELHDLSGPSKQGPYWGAPAEKMKNRKPFVLPLSGLALELLRDNLKTDPQAPLFIVSKKDRLDGAARRIVATLKMERWTPHDLRRTAATILDRAGYSLDQIGKQLAHERKGVTKIYARWGHFDLKREMAREIESAIREAITDESAAVAA
jgi:integrase